MMDETGFGHFDVATRDFSNGGCKVEMGGRVVAKIVQGGVRCEKQDLEGKRKQTLRGGFLRLYLPVSGLV